MREPLQTDRLILRDITEADAELLFDLDSDPDVMRYINSQPVPDVTSYRERIRSAYLPWQAHPWHGLRLVSDRVSGEFLGWVFIRPATASSLASETGWHRNDEVEIGYRFRRSAWGRGIAVEAAAPLVEFALTDDAISAVVACAQTGNDRSLRVLSKLGLERVGEVVLSATNAVTVRLSRPKSR